MSSSEPLRAAQAELAQAIKRMTWLLEQDPSLRVLNEGDGVTPTDVVVIACALLDAAEVEIFELALWQAWGIPGARSPAAIEASDARE